MYSYWDKSYDLTRANVSGDNIITKSSQLSSMKAMNGYFINMSSEFLDYLWMEIAYQDLYSEDDRNKSFQWSAEGCEDKNEGTFTKIYLYFKM